MSTGPAAEIKSRLSVVEVVGETVALKRAGSAYKGLCPFHAEKTPSFVVSPDRETWHCFGCGVGGDIFAFLMRRDGVDFREALGRLAERAGVELSERTAREDRQRRRLREALEAAIAWYREVLLQWPGAEAARHYLEERGLSEATLDRFTIGYAPATWDALTKRLRDRGFTQQELVAAGLASSSRRGGVIDRFRARIIIPIRDASGRAIGLGGRILPGRDEPKYLNSPATPLFDKSRTLFAIDLAKAAIRRERLAVIVEGYTDVMAAHQAGFENVVASLGTALTGGQIELATRYADAIALAYDVDMAGQAATTRGLLEELGPDQSVGKVRVVRIPAGKDPDELIRNDPEAWRQAVADAKPVIEYFVDRLAGELDTRSAEGRSELGERILDQLARIRNEVQRDAYIPLLARQTGIDERVLRDSLQRRVRRGAIARRPAPAAAGSPPASEAPRLSPLEIEAIELILRHRALAAAPELDGPLPMRDATAVAIVDAARDSLGAGAGLADFVATLDPAVAEVATAVLDRTAAEPALSPDEAAAALRDCILRLRIQRIDEAIADGQLLLRDAEDERDEGRARVLRRELHERHRLREELKQLTMHEPADLAAARR